MGVFSTPHGEIETPVFMPVGTVAAVKTMSPDDLKQAGAQIILANTYHLYLRPGDSRIRKLGGLHNFMKWNGPILTDSGGYQVFSLSAKGLERGATKIKSAKISERGVKFYSHLDGSEHFLTPESSIKIQENLGSDIVMAFDECPPVGDRSKVKSAMERTHRWLIRCVRAKKRRDQALFPICQGGTFKDLRIASAKFINDLDLPGNAIGGVSVGEPKAKIYKVADWCTDILTEGKPRYLMGIGYPEDIVEVVKRGIDMFDCVLPTRLARHRIAWVKSRRGIRLGGLGFGYEQIDLSKSKYQSDKQKLDESCDCYTCKTGFSRSYLRHLMSENEPLGIHLMTIHNLRFVFNLVEKIKSSIKAGTL
jgi:queuine tRNA-ribosyltransferase